jgi:hypothetical protein
MLDSDAPKTNQFPKLVRLLTSRLEPDPGALQLTLTLAQLPT